MQTDEKENRNTNDNHRIMDRESVDCLLLDAVANATLTVRYYLSREMVRGAVSNASA